MSSYMNFEPLKKLVGKIVSEVIDESGDVSFAIIFTDDTRLSIGYSSGEGSTSLDDVELDT